MELVEVEITGMAITARHGTLNTGDILRTDAAFAKHLVEDCGAAKYTAPKAAATAAPALPAAAPVARVAKKKDKPAPLDAEAADAPASTPALDAPVIADVCTDPAAAPALEAPASADVCTDPAIAPAADTESPKG